MDERLYMRLSEDVYNWLLHSSYCLVQTALSSLLVNGTFHWVFEVLVQIFEHLNVLCQLFIRLLSISLRYLKSTVQSFNLIFSTFFDSFDSSFLLGLQSLYFALKISWQLIHFFRMSCLLLAEIIFQNSNIFLKWANFKSQYFLLISWGIWFSG